MQVAAKKQHNAGIAQLVERCLAKAKVAGSNPVSRSILRSVGAPDGRPSLFFTTLYHSINFYYFSIIIY